MPLVQQRTISRRRKAFADALQQVMAERGWDQAFVAKRTNYSQQTVSKWVTTQRPPDSPWLVFEIEERLGLPPGYLSRHLGYIPTEASQNPLEDPRLDDEMRRTLTSLYRSLVAISESRSGSSARTSKATSTAAATARNASSDGIPATSSPPDA